ncbi:hypothetical protein [Deinococcus cellulosilyticus]|uniref:DUF4426 domain-containing protein n=1 Tax=Deinococcus cellulosilyticus (strain DSM 18568 / NBRC 106333 / KACC 11606 / 5516J-15) TaxID=1223518 RepID=A0A511N5A5_DEIC1|nr:hypothetical protein [Deinococcus cellulosilyticus]GEM48023.1 hypothetical protein DC3_36580 [Deinococcus cellulosilyticus NBRC 106333 = KACC 11606]
MKKWLAVSSLLLSSALAHGGHVELESAVLKKVSGGYVLVASINYHEKDTVNITSAVVGGLPGVFQQKNSRGYHTIKKIPLKTGNTRFGAGSSYRVFFKTLPKVNKLYLTLLMSGNVLGQEIRLVK